MEFKQKVIAFIDILGWKDRVHQAELGVGLTLADLLALLECFGTEKERDYFAENGPQCCPKALYKEQHLDFRLTKMSDSVIVTAEISPAGVINLIDRCWRAVLRLLERGVMCRGYIKFGSVYHEDAGVILGSGYQDAYAAEGNVTAFKREADERGTPFVQLDSAIVSYVENCNDACVKKMYSRMTRHDGDVTALFPFQRIKHHVVPEQPGGVGRLTRQRQSNANVRQRIQGYKARVESLVNRDNPSGVRKSQHYLAALDQQLKVCDETDAAIDLMEWPPQQAKGD